VRFLESTQGLESLTPPLNRKRRVTLLKVNDDLSSKFTWKTPPVQSTGSSLPRDSDSECDHEGDQQSQWKVHDEEHQLRDYVYSTPSTPSEGSHDESSGEVEDATTGSDDLCDHHYATWNEDIEGYECFSCATAFFP